jgi:hypothetical protein
MIHLMVRRNVLIAGLFLLAGCAVSGGSQDRIAGDWYYRDSGGYLTYHFNSGGTFTAIAQMTAQGYPKVEIRKRGNYTVNGDAIRVTPTEVIVNGSPGSIVEDTGRYDANRDKLILQQANTSNQIEYSRQR